MKRYWRTKNLLHRGARHSVRLSGFFHMHMRAGRGGILFPVLLLAASCGDGGGVPGAATGGFPTGWAPRTAEVPPDRAVWASLDASSSRFGLLPNHGRSMLDLFPLTWPRLLPRFAQDGSLLTRWASQGNERPYISFRVVSDAEAPVRVKRIVLEWAEEVPGRYRLETSEDGISWRTRHHGSPAPNETEELVLPDSAEPVRILRVRVPECPPLFGISLRNVSVFPRPDGCIPPPVSRISVQETGPFSTRLSWHPVPEAFLYRVYRLASADDPPSEEDRVGETRLPFYTDGRLAPGTRYVYRIVPESFSGNSGGARVHVSVQTEMRAASPPFRYRGVVEGFYNQPWSHPDRKEMIRFLGAAGMNFYLYAPKVEGFHRAHWREPYPEREIELFADLVRTARKHGIEFCYGLSPGMDYRWNDPGEPDRILAKFRVFYEIGVRAFCLLFDDTPETSRSDGALAEKHVSLLEDVLAVLHSWQEDIQLFFVPTIYFKTVSDLRRSHPQYVEYLEGLSRLPPEVGIFWVGPGAPYSPEIRLEQAEELAGLLGRKILIWDNYPASDNFFLFEPFFGPYRNRDATLFEAVAGILSNPMNYPNLSKVALYTLSRYLLAPVSYDPEEAFEQAIRAVGEAGGTEPLRIVARQFYGHPVIPPTDIESPEIQALLPSFWEEYNGPGYPGEYAAALKECFEEFAGLVQALEHAVMEEPLRSELRGPAEKITRYGEAGLTGLEILARIHKGDTNMVEQLLVRLEDLLQEAEQFSWRAGQNRLDRLGAVLFGSPPVEVDVIGGFLRTIRAMAREQLQGKGSAARRPAAQEKVSFLPNIP